VSRLFPRIELLAQQPRPKGCRKLTGKQGLWRIRIGDYRVVYSIDDVAKAVDIIAIRHRSGVYDN
jgi:mRNA interferase RelE/StbE